MCKRRKFFLDDLKCGKNVHEKREQGRPWKMNRTHRRWGNRLKQEGKAGRLIGRKNGGWGKTTTLFSAYAQLDVNAEHAAFLLFSGPASAPVDLSPMAPSFKGSCFRMLRETQHSGATRFFQGAPPSRGRGAHRETL